VMADNSKEKVAHFWSLCANIHIVYDLYRRLYFATPRRFELYDAVARLSFRQLHHILKEYIVLQFAKITDPAKTGKTFNYTTNYVIEEIDWPDDVHKQLTEINARLMTFREYVKDVRNQRIAHYDLNAEIEQKVLGIFPENSEIAFLWDLDSFVNIAYCHSHSGNYIPITHATSPDIDNLVEALAKARVFDLCAKCNETERFAALTAFEHSSP
jgi:hypothetical protein